MWVSTERSYRLIQTPFKSAKNLFSTELLLSWYNYKFMTTASKYPGKTPKKQFQFQFYNCHRSSRVVVVPIPQFNEHLIVWFVLKIFLTKLNTPSFFVFWSTCSSFRFYCVWSCFIRCYDSESLQELRHDYDWPSLSTGDLVFRTTSFHVEL